MNYLAWIILVGTIVLVFAAPHWVDALFATSSGPNCPGMDPSWLGWCK